MCLVCCGHVPDTCCVVHVLGMHILIKDKGHISMFDGRTCNQHGWHSYHALKQHVCVRKILYFSCLHGEGFEEEGCRPKVLQ